MSRNVHIVDFEGKVKFKRSLIVCKDRCSINLPKFIQEMGNECLVTVDTINKTITIKFI